MITTLFIILISLSFILLTLGYSTKDDSLKLIGFFFIILLGIVLINNNLEYNSTDITEECNYLLNSSTSINNLTNYNYIEYCSNSTTTKQFIPYDNTRTYGIWLVILCMLGFAGVYLQYRRRS